MNSERILAAGVMQRNDSLPLFSVAQLRALEAAAAAALPPHTLMQRAGLALARWTLALAPHARTVWIACGPGNNGGDGFESAVHLQAWGKTVHISHQAPTHYAQDASLSIAKARDAGVSIGTDVPHTFDVCIDALFGIGRVRLLGAEHLQWVQAMHASGKPILAVDCPSGLDTDTGSAQPCTVHAHATLTFLGLKPGLFTNQGRDTCGDLWFNALGVESDTPPAAHVSPRPASTSRTHASHKGSFGDVAVVGGDEGMLGAALLAARAALRSGAGRVYASPLAPHTPTLDGAQPELMFRPPDVLDWRQLSVVAGCGGGKGIKAWLPTLLPDSAALVLDADALNAVAELPALWPLLVSRGTARPTVLTPHPLEAARLLSSTVAEVQGNRLCAAQTLADTFNACVVLKGSGTVVATPGRTPCINPTGNARLATAGSGDVLAGMVGAALANGQSAWEAATSAVYWHGLAAQGQGPELPAVPASELLIPR